MTHKEIVELDTAIRVFQRQASNRASDEESYALHELLWYANLSSALRKLLPLLDDAQRKAGRRERVEEQNVT